MSRELRTVSISKVANGFTVQAYYSNPEKQEYETETHVANCIKSYSYGDTTVAGILQGLFEKPVEQVVPVFDITSSSPL
jgi:hypothetical protein